MPRTYDEWVISADYAAGFLMSGSATIEYVPEPGTALLMGLGLAGLGVFRRSGATYL